MPAAITTALTAAGIGPIAASLIVGAGQIILSLGASAAIGAIRRRRQAADETQSGVRQEMLRQEIPPRIKWVGTLRVSGSVWWWANDNSVLDNTMFVGVAVNHGRIGSISEFWVDDKQVTIDASGEIETAPYDTAETERILFHLGKPSELQYDVIATSFGVSDVRGDGVATVLGMFEAQADAADQAAIYPSGPPKIRVTMTGSVAWDPRDPTQDRHDESTWHASDNVVVQALNYMMSPEGYGWPWDRIEPVLGELMAEMDLCDDPVELKAGGTEKRYRVAGGWRLDTDPADVVAKFEEVCGGRIWPKRDGTLGIRVGRYRPPQVTFTGAEIVGYELTAGPDLFDPTLGVRAQYLSPAHGYRIQDADPWPNASAVTAGAEGRSGSLDLSWSPSHGQARRLMKRHHARQNAHWRGQIYTTLAGLRALDESTIRAVIEEFGEDGLDETFEVTGGISIDLATLQVVIPVRSIDPSIDDWDPAIEEGDAPELPAEFSA